MNSYQCPECGYRFNEAEGDSFLGYPPATQWEALPDDFVCPDCAVTGKDDFEQVASAG